MCNKRILKCQLFWNKVNDDDDDDDDDDKLGIM